MRSSSVIFVGGFTLVFGFFATESFNADANALRTADIRAQQLQADLIATAGVYLAAYYMATPSSYDGWVVNNRNVNGGKLSYVISYDASVDPNRATVTCVGKMDDITVTKRATLQKGASGTGWYYRYWNQWNVSKVYTEPYTLADIESE